MITKFDSLYAGHTDLGNIGYGGTPINERRYSNAHLATALSKAESMATLMEGLGYNCFWMAEHHFQREGTECIPNTILIGIAPRAPNEKHQDWLWHHSDVASAAAGGGLRYR
jgi:alkanesulfonate monooxygenase SsuD/methylene tetrahydromethanopterin reductase-like flavin-dependent oxidoreductase (luciferase family)